MAKFQLHSTFKRGVMSADLIETMNYSPCVSFRSGKKGITNTSFLL